MALQDFTDGILMAYADGMLDPAETERVRIAVERDPEVAARVAFFARTREVLRDAAAARPAAPLPAALLQRVETTLAAARAGTLRAATNDSAQSLNVEPDISPLGAGQGQGATVVPLPPQERRVPALPRWNMALAASVALVVGAIGGFLVSIQTRPGAGSNDGLPISVLTDAQIVAALEATPSGERVPTGTGAEISVISSFLNGDGDFCRETQYVPASGQAVVSVICRVGSVWDLHFAVSAPDANAEGYMPASSLETLDAFLAATGAGAPLSPEDERAALSRFNR